MHERVTPHIAGPPGGDVVIITLNRKPIGIPMGPLQLAGSNPNGHSDLGCSNHILLRFANNAEAEQPFRDQHRLRQPNGHRLY